MGREDVLARPDHHRRLRPTTNLINRHSFNETYRSRLPPSRFGAHRLGLQPARPGRRSGSAASPSASRSRRPRERRSLRATRSGSPHRREQGLEGACRAGSKATGAGRASRQGWAGCRVATGTSPRESGAVAAWVRPRASTSAPGTRAAPRAAPTRRRPRCARAGSRPRGRRPPRDQVGTRVGGRGRDRPRSAQQRAPHPDRRSAGRSGPGAIRGRGRTGYPRDFCGGRASHRGPPRGRRPLAVRAARAGRHRATAWLQPPVKAVS